MAKRSVGIVRAVVALTFLLVLLVIGLAFYTGARTIQQLLAENKELRRAIERLTHEDQIGYAKVLEQFRDESGTLFTKLLFVETERDDPTRRILEKEYVVEGDVVHFDALVVRFDNRFVADGKERALYMWRRVYGETMRPSDGFPIETPGEAPERYRELFSQLRLKDRTLFWNEIWELANRPDKLREYGVRAVNGVVNYNQLRPGLIYVFKISNTGLLYPEVVPQM